MAGGHPHLPPRCSSPPTRDMLDLLGGLDRVRGIERGHGTVEIEVAIPEIGLVRALRKLLQIAARADVVLPFGTRVRSSTSACSGGLRCATTDPG